MALTGGARHGRSVARRTAALLIAIGIAVLAWLVEPTADAHAGLRAASPGIATHLQRVPGRVRLDFAQPQPDGTRTTVVVLSPKDANLSRGPASTSAMGVTQPIRTVSDRGPYQVSYTLVSVNGQVTRGQYWFTYAAPLPQSVSSLLSWCAAMLLAVVLATGLTLLQRRRIQSLILHPTDGAHPNAGPAPVIPAQRTPMNHDGLSPSGRRPRPTQAPTYSGSASGVRADTAPEPVLDPPRTERT